jgi:hypothetical protein
LSSGNLNPDFLFSESKMSTDVKVSIRDIRSERGLGCEEKALVPDVVTSQIIPLPEMGNVDTGSCHLVSMVAHWIPITLASAVEVKNESKNGFLEAGLSNSEEPVENIYDSTRKLLVIEDPVFKKDELSLDLEDKKVQTGSCHLVSMVAHWKPIKLASPVEVKNESKNDHLEAGLSNSEKKTVGSIDDSSKKLALIEDPVSKKGKFRLDLDENVQIEQMAKWNSDWKAVCKDVENSEMIIKTFKTDKSNEGPSEQDVTIDESFFSCTNDQTITNISMEDPFESFAVDADETMETDNETETCKEKDANGTFQDRTEEKNDVGPNDRKFSIVFPSVKSKIMAFTEKDPVFNCHSCFKTFTNALEAKKCFKGHMDTLNSAIVSDHKKDVKKKVDSSLFDKVPLETGILNLGESAFWFNVSKTDYNQDEVEKVDSSLFDKVPSNITEATGSLNLREAAFWFNVSKTTRKMDKAPLVSMVAHYISLTHSYTENTREAPIQSRDSFENEALTASDQVGSNSNCFVSMVAHWNPITLSLADKGQ